jgi:short-subunit dehydrogenase
MRRTIVITGASSGIGKALALRYARDAPHLALLGRNAERLERVAAECCRLGAQVEIATIDVRARIEMREWLERRDEAGAIDLVIANAGVMVGRPPGGLLEDQIDSISLLETNVLGIVNTIQPLLPRMISRSRGQIGITGSIASFVPLPDAPSYCASKAAVLNYGLALRGLLREKGIRVSVICPGYVETPMSQQESGRKPFEMPAARAAALIARGLERDQPIVAFPFWFALGSRMSILLPDRARQSIQQAFRFTVSKLQPGIENQAANDDEDRARDSQFY